MPRYDHEIAFHQFRAFITCEADAAFFRLGGQTLHIGPGTPCYTRKHDTLFLCADCQAFWQDCHERGDRSTWEMAATLREARTRQPQERCGRGPQPQAH